MRFRVADIGRPQCEVARMDRRIPVRVGDAVILGAVSDPTRRCGRVLDDGDVSVAGRSVPCGLHDEARGWMARRKAKNAASGRGRVRQLQDTDRAMMAALASFGDPLAAVHAIVSSPMGMHRYLSLAPVGGTGN
jgi:hypothetical protein